MNATNRYLDALASKLGGASDYRLAKVLGVVHGAVSRYRAGGGHLSNAACFKVAELLELNPAEVIAAVEADRARDADSRAWWQGQLRRFGAAAASVLLAAGIGGNPRPATAGGLSVDFTELYITRQRRRRGARGFVLI